MGSQLAALSNIKVRLEVIYLFELATICSTLYVSARRPCLIA